MPKQDITLAPHILLKAWSSALFADSVLAKLAYLMFFGMARSTAAAFPLSLHGSLCSNLAMTALLWLSPAVSCLQAVAVALYNPEAFRTLGQVRLDVGRVLPEHMTDEAYRELLVCLSSLYIH